MPYNIHCEKCGHEFEVEKWHPGLPCTKCKAPDTIPKTKMGGKPQGQNLSSVNDNKPGAKAGWKNSPAVAGIAIVVIIMTWVGLGSWKFKKPQRMKVEVWAVCTECKERVKKLADEVRNGANCAKCGKKRCVYTEYECRGNGDKECGNTFAFIPPPPGPNPYRSPENWEKMSEEERTKAMRELNESMMKHERAQMEASSCPKCKAYNSGPVYTEEQKKKFEELRAKYSKKK